jgi:lipoate-protein ligase A
MSNDRNDPELPELRIHLLVDGPCDPAWNMAVDDALLHLRQIGVISGTWMRLFGWSPPAVSLGRLQAADQELDLNALAAAGIPVVRRSTGGKAVYHAHELTYSLVGGVPDPLWGGNLHETYRRVTALIADALANLGVATTLASGRPGRESILRGAVRPEAPRPEGEGFRSGPSLASACFAVAYGHELIHEGRKICGSAQRRLTRAFLQHGSLLLGPEQARLARFLRSDHQDHQGPTPTDLSQDHESLIARLRAETIDVSSALGRPVGAGEMTEAVRRVLAARFGPQIQPMQLPDAILQEASSRLEEVLIAATNAPAPRTDAPPSQ